MDLSTEMEVDADMANRIGSKVKVEVLKDESKHPIE